jgi:outer membrane receptor protein involved in Fe transport
MLRARNRKSGGTFETEANAFYLEDIWNITPNLMLNLGVRWDRFETAPLPARRSSRWTT